ncbi:MAG TPA: hypothetical protein VNQ76_03030 [Planctomicrobium sp.]|nr:hypothetical protein [Planctomicrobium sp.]
MIFGHSEYLADRARNTRGARLCATALRAVPNAITTGAGNSFGEKWL